MMDQQASTPLCNCTSLQSLKDSMQSATLGQAYILKMRNKVYLLNKIPTKVFL